MESLYKPYQHLNAGQLKFLCFLAYTGKKTDENTQTVYRHGEELTVDEVKKLINGLRGYYHNEYFSYRNEYQLHAYHVAPLMLYMLEKMPQWREHFDKFYLQYQAPKATELLSRLQKCIENKPVEEKINWTGLHEAEVLVPLASDTRFLPLMTKLQDIRHFVNDVVFYQTENDIADPLNIIGQIASRYYSLMMPAQARNVKATLALYDCFNQGRYDEDVVGKKTTR